MASSFVVQEIIAVLVVEVAEIADKTGGVVSGSPSVINVISLEVAKFPEASFDRIWKWYVVEAVSPVSVWLCEVTSDALYTVLNS